MDKRNKSVSLKHLIKNDEKGAITLFVLVVMLFFIIFAVGVYVFNSNKLSAQIKDIAKIQEEYSSKNDIDEIYDETIDGEDQGIEIILTYKESGDVYDIKTWTNKVLNAEILIPDGAEPNEYTVKVGNETYDYVDIAESGIDIYENCKITVYKNGDAGKSVNITRIDKVDPNVTFYPNKEQNFTVAKGGTVDISTILTVDDNASGIVKVEYGWTTTPDGIPTELTTVNKEINGEKITTQVGEGTYYLYVKATDLAGNEITKYSDKIQVVIDEQKPTIDVTATKEDGTDYPSGEWTNQTVTIHVDGEDNDERVYNLVCGI